MQFSFRISHNGRFFLVENYNFHVFSRDFPNHVDFLRILWKFRTIKIRILLQKRFHSNMRRVGQVSTKSLHNSCGRATHNWMCVFKGQIISKGLFGVLEFSQKTNERIRFYYYDKFVSLFFGRIQGHQKVLSKLSDL